MAEVTHQIVIELTRGQDAPAEVRVKCRVHGERLEVRETFGPFEPVTAVLRHAYNLCYAWCSGVFPELALEEFHAGADTSRTRDGSAEV